MRTLIATCVLVSLSAVGIAADEPQLLADAVSEFNVRQLNNSTGKLQPPLTTEEVVAAIRGWIRERTPVAEEIYQTFQEIAESGELPASAKLSYSTHWIYKGYEIDVWWVDLTVMTGEKTFYTFRIRDQKISSRPRNAPKVGP